MLASAPFLVGGRQYLVAQFADGTYVGRTNLIAGVPFRPAKPGEVITAYGIGFGEVSPSISPGRVVGQQNTTTLPVDVFFSGSRAVLSYQGLAPSFVGLYQFNMVVPTVADGDHLIDVRLGGQPLPQAPFYLTVQR
jgi:uncharacterized protein (TIGR03437 family)